MKFQLLAFLVFLQFNSFSQSNYQHWEWAKSFGGSGNDSVVDIKVKNDFMYVTGFFSSPTISWDNTTLSNNGSNDIFVAKLDSSGNTVWIKAFGGNADDRVSQLEVNDQGTIVLLCASETAQLNIGSVQLDTAKHFYIKLDSDGNVQGANRLLSDLSYNDIEIDEDGGVYLAGTYATVFTFGDSVVSLQPPATLPAGVPSIEIAPGAFIYYYNTTPPNYSTGAVLLKYDVNGNADWLKPFHTDINSSDSYLGIEYDNERHNIVAMLNYKAPLDFNNTFYSYTGSPLPVFGIFSTLITQVSKHGNIVSIGQSNGTASNFEMNNNGLAYTTRYSGRIVSGTTTALYAIRNAVTVNSLIENTTPSGSSGGRLLGLGAIKLDDHGNLLLSGFKVLDTNFIVADSFAIPETRDLFLSEREMDGKNGLYFGDSFLKDTLSIKKYGALSDSEIVLYNHGGSDIFLGKYRRLGYMPLAFKTFNDTIKVCDGTIAVNLDSSYILKNYGAGDLSYHWEPASNFIHPDSLITGIIMNSDTLKSTLTVIDAEGNFIKKEIVFYGGINSDMHLLVSNISPLCGNMTVPVTLQGTIFSSCYIKPDLYSGNDFNIQYPSSIFHSLGETVNFDVSNLKNFITLTLSEPSKYCISDIPVQINKKQYTVINKEADVCSGVSYTYEDGYSQTYYINTGYYNHTVSFKAADGCDSIIILTTIKIHTPTDQTQNVSVCASSNYTFPDNTIANNITSAIDHISHLTSRSGCDSIIHTFITINRGYNQTENISVCSGNNYTFPDNTVTNNITSAIDHISHFTSAGGCDSIIHTFITINQGYTQTESIPVCPGNDYTFPDNTIATNIASPINHTSHLTSHGGCDSIITTNITIASGVYDQTENITLCRGNFYRFPDLTEVTHLISNMNHVSHLHTQGGCDSTITTNITMIDIDTAVVKNGAVLTSLSNNTAAQYQWLDCNLNNPITGATQQSYTAITPGNYILTITGANGCADTSSCYTITTTDFAPANNFLTNLYPQPVNNILTMIVQTDVPTNLDLSLLDISGNAVDAEKYNLVVGANTITLNVSNLSTGTYFLKLYKADTQQTVIKQIIKN